MSSRTAPRRIGRRIMGVHAGIVFAFFYAPIAILIIFSFSGDRIVGQWGGFTLDWYREFWNNDQLTNSITVSLQVALIATVASVVLGTLSALALERFRFRGRRVFDALLYLPIIIPDVTMGIMMLVFFAEGIDVLDSLLGIGLAKGITTIALSHIAFCISFVSVVVRARLSGMDSRLEEAAMDLYATRWQTFRFVTLPQILPGVAGGGLLALTLSLDDVVISQFTSGPGATTLPVYVFSLIRKGVTPMINSVSVVMFVASLVLIAAMLAVDRLRSTASSVPSAVPGGDLSAEPAVGGHERGDT